MPAAHVLRKGPKAVKPAAAVVQAPAYPEGFFTEPVRAWKQLQFVSQILVDPRTKRYVTDATLTRLNRGFDRHPLGLPNGKPIEGEQTFWRVVAGLA